MTFSWDHQYNFNKKTSHKKLQYSLVREKRFLRKKSNILMNTYLEICAKEIVLIVFKTIIEFDKLMLFFYEQLMLYLFCGSNMTNQFKLELSLSRNMRLV